VNKALNEMSDGVYVRLLNTEVECPRRASRNTTYEHERVCPLYTKISEKHFNIPPPIRLALQEGCRVSTGR
jgi:hypothetical protein